jgi:adenylate kinase
MVCTQVHFIEDLHAHLQKLHKSTLQRPELRERYPKPSFKVVVLYVDEATSITRQLARQAKSVEHNQKVLEACAGTIM